MRNSPSVGSWGIGCYCARDLGGGPKKGTGTKRETSGSVMVFLGQVPPELENKAPAIRGQEAERASKGAGHQVRRESNQGRCWLGSAGCMRKEANFLHCFVSLSSGEEEDDEGGEESKAGTGQQPSEDEEEERLNQSLAEMKAQEVAELKR